MGWERRVSGWLGARHIPPQGPPARPKPRQPHPDPPRTSRRMDAAASTPARRAGSRSTSQQVGTDPGLGRGMSVGARHIPPQRTPHAPNPANRTLIRPGHHAEWMPRHPLLRDVPALGARASRWNRPGFGARNARWGATYPAPRATARPKPRVVPPQGPPHAPDPRRPAPRATARPRPRVGPPQGPPHAPKPRAPQPRRQAKPGGDDEGPVRVWTGPSSERRDQPQEPAV